MHVHETKGKLALPRHRPCPWLTAQPRDADPSARFARTAAPAPHRPGRRALQRHRCAAPRAPCSVVPAQSPPRHSARGSVCPQGEFSSCSTAG